jgi:hypothetical protein
MTLRVLILIATLSASIFLRTEESNDQPELAKVAEWTAAEGISGEISGTPLRALGYEAPVPTKQKAFRSGEITHLFYVTNAGEILLGYIDQQVTILWRVEKGKEIKATAHGDMAERRMWSVPNAEHADLFAKEAAFWIDRWGEYRQRKLE